MEKKASKHPCTECVWQLWTGTSEIVMCPFPVCKRAEYERILRKQREQSHEGTAPDD